jgi:hypothetical protein
MCPKPRKAFKVSSNDAGCTKFMINFKHFVACDIKLLADLFLKCFVKERAET